MAEQSDMTTAIFAWLNQVNADPDLPGSCLKVALQQTQKTSTAEFMRSGALVTWQSMETIGSAIKMSVRTVRNMVKLMQSREHLNINAGHGPGHSNRYTMLIHNRQQTAASMDDNEAAGCRIDEDSNGSAMPHSRREKRQSDVPDAAAGYPRSGSLLPPNISYNNSTNSSRARGPSCPDGLGPAGAHIRASIGDDKFASWFGKVRFVSELQGTVTLRAPTKFIRDTIMQQFGDVMHSAWQAIDPEFKRVVVMTEGGNR